MTCRTWCSYNLLINNIIENAYIDIPTKKSATFTKINDVLDVCFYLWEQKKGTTETHYLKYCVLIGHLVVIRRNACISAQVVFIYFHFDTT